MHILNKRPRRGGRAAVAGALVALGLAGAAVGAPAASARITPPDCWWHPLSLANGWQSAQNQWDTGNPSYCVTSDGMVYLSGSLTQPGGGSDEVAVLPPQARPASNMYLSVYSMSGTVGVLQIDTDGGMFAYNANSGGNVTAFTSLAGVSFPGTTVAQQSLSLLNGWKSAQGEWGTGDPSYSVTSDQVIHLSGSLDGSQVTPGLSDDAAEEFAVLPSGARPFWCSSTETYTYAGVPGVLAVEPTGAMYAYATGGHIYNTPSAQYTSLAGISLVEASVLGGKALALASGWNASTDSGCTNSDTVDPGYNLINGVVYLSGDMISSSFPSGGTFATLPAEARPTHTLYLILNEGPAMHASLEIDPNGNMTLFGSGFASGVDSLTGLSYQVTS
jgi:hypothetical protein